jgi:ribosomal protein L24E
MKRSLILLLVALAIVIGLPVLGHLSRARAPDECALDGVKIEPWSRVRVVAADGRQYEFCSVKCAELWIGAQKRGPRAVYVTDEATGQELDSAAAWYVVGRWVTTPSGNRIHVFASRQAAEDSAGALDGVVLDAANKPFRHAAQTAAR